MRTPGPCVEGPHLTWHHSPSHGMSKPAMQWGGLPLGVRWKQLQAPPLPVWWHKAVLYPSAGTKSVLSASLTAYPKRSTL